MAVVAAMAGETLDAVVWRVMGSVAGLVERVLEDNPHVLAAVTLSEGALINLPDSAPESARPRAMIRLWD